ncbi:DUF6766 family protein [Microbacterium sediminis]|uniref:Uncharacterized protein n=1 Tax=Microbacterium sediminis TaxID=904291 RepID=A0A1B9NDU0_9MICO|nr:DUF6766 family protein [Microbacterium sediminis]OCG74743.1 hypothetical protein A7J15_04230 [Microbacterium sediminis]QBR75043.1 hypothetical protein E3O41_11965 [Microbacterium sediminis]
MSRFVKDAGLSLFFLAIFVLALVGQAFAGHAQNNEELLRHGQPPESMWQFVTSSEFAVDVAENWQSEFFQFFLFILMTVWLVQHGSPESKKPGDEGLGSDADQLLGPHARPDSPAWAKVEGARRWLLSNSLLLVMGAVFVFSWLAQSLAGAAVANEEAMQHGEPPMTWLAYLGTADFWNRTLQNWQSEFLAVGCMVAFSIYLRQRGSAESKPVGTPHHVSSEESQ